MEEDEAASLRLWPEKRGEIEPENLSCNLIVQLGTVTEDLNRLWYERNTGHVVRDVQRRIQHPVHKWTAATSGNAGLARATFQQISPYVHLISGRRATIAKMFVNNGSGQRGLVCQYDVVCFDEVSRISFDQKDGVNIMKGYMASGQFNRGKGSVVMVGNLDVDDNPLQSINLEEPKGTLRNQFRTRQK